ncbi:uncharacterized protein LOC131856415 [Cryptomeria japonica]|uniref:uncharacterized protein LOC131856415 n=1 Tax=Cryptomeria japonica TaxID=3369 RepID=UPI0027DA09DC|nr:uncharacterized protein LOC131856415 [Cryptomeria japonica]
MREKHPTTQQLCEQLTKAEIDCICVTGLYDMMHLLVIRMNCGLLTALAKRWHSETCFFHLAMGEMTVTLEDIWRILHIPIRGELVTYDRHLGTTTIERIFADDVYIEDGFVAWEDIAALYEPLPSVLAGIVGGLLYPNRHSHGLAVGWGQVQMVTKGTGYAWGYVY